MPTKIEQNLQSSLHIPFLNAVWLTFILVHFTPSLLLLKIHLFLFSLSFSVLIYFPILFLFFPLLSFFKSFFVNPLYWVIIEVNLILYSRYPISICCSILFEIASILLTAWDIFHLNDYEMTDFARYLLSDYIGRLCWQNISLMRTQLMPVCRSILLEFIGKLLVYCWHFAYWVIYIRLCFLLTFRISLF